MHASPGGWDTSVSRDTHYVLCQSLIVSVRTNICKLNLEKDFLDLDVNGNVLLATGLKELFHQMIFYTEFGWVVFGSCGVVL